MEWIFESRDLPLQMHWLSPVPPENTDQSFVNRVRCIAGGGSVPEVFAVAKALAEIISQHFDVWVHRILRRQYAYLDRREREVMVVRVMEMLEQEERTASRLRIDRIAVAVLMFLYQHDVLNIEGLEDFLLQDIAGGFSILIDKAIDDYFAELEHAQFVEFLKMYLQNRAAHVGSVYVFIGRGNHMTVCDGSGRNIGAAVIADLCDGLDFSQDEQVWQEVVISALVLLGPRNIIFVNDIPTSLHEVLWSIFDGHVTVHDAGLYSADDPHRHLGWDGDTP